MNTIHLFEFVQLFVRFENGHETLDQRFFDIVIHKELNKLDGYS